MAEVTERPRQQRPRLTVDFVTALTLEECQQRLTDNADRDHLALSLHEDIGFTLRTPSRDNPATEIRFWGTLEQVERGTWVWGAILEEIEGEEADDHVSPLRAFVVVLLLFLAAEALLRDDLRMMLVWGGALLFLVVVAVVVWRRNYRQGLEVVDWIYETLYVPPGRR